MLHNFLFAIWFLLPAAIANAAPIFTAVLPGLNKFDAPIDYNKLYKNQPILGPHKTWRGLLSGIVVATLVFVLQQYLVRHTGWAATIVTEKEYLRLPLLLGPLFGFGAIAGDALESFIKRRRNIKSGQSWLVFDQLDYVIGGVLVSLPFVILSLHQYALIFVVWFVMHLLASYVGFKLRLKDSPI
ncbi:MAG: CDP-archaeol synthase [Patescibacteria group bacterium]|nr:CDP-archaeol synthase [Patescibacteria group bacterium]